MRARKRAYRRLLFLPLALGIFALLFGRSLRGQAGQADGPLRVPAGDSPLGTYSFRAPESPTVQETPQPQTPVTEEAARSGGLTLLNRTDYSVDVQALLAEPLNIRLETEAPQILIIHTHGSEAYTPEGEDQYIPTDPSRTEDRNFNMIRVGDALTDALRAQGFQVIHDRELYDYPSYNGSYTRSLEAVERYLAEYPTIGIVLDIHRDAVQLEDGSYYKSSFQLDGAPSSQVMLCVGTDGSGLEHPDWRENLKLALHLQQAMVEQEPALARPITLVNSRYNQHTGPGSLIVEVGYNGNSLQEALAAARAFARAAGTVFSELT